MPVRVLIGYAKNFIVNGDTRETAGPAVFS